MKSCTSTNKSNIARFTKEMLPLALGAGVLAVMPLTVDAQVGRGGYSGAGAGVGAGRPMGGYSPSAGPSYSRPTYTPTQSFSRPSYTMPSGSSYSRPGDTVPSTGTQRSVTGSYYGQGTSSYQQTPYHYTPSTYHRPNNVNSLVNNSSNYIHSNNQNHYHYGVPVNNRYYYGFGPLAYSPYYAPYFSLGYTALSPFAYYDSGYSPFITLGGLYNSPPQYVYVPYPVYQDGVYQGPRNEDVDGYYLNRNQNPNNTAPNSGNANNPNSGSPNTGATDNTYHVGEGGKSIAKDTALDTTINDLRDAWKTNKIAPLAKHVRRDTKVAIYLRGKYQYSIDSGDYLDMTRDALQVTKTVRFDIDTVQRKQKDVYVVLGRHIYRDADGNEHTVHVNYVLERSDNDYVITQVGSAPDKVDEQP